jgi:voltage-gated potassium channel
MIISKRLLLKLILLIVLILLGATIVFALTEHIEISEALYRSVYISLSHHDNFHMDSTGARIVIIGLIVASLVFIAYLLKTIGEYIINIGDGLQRNKVKAKLVNTKDHYIVCGLGRVGRNIAKELHSEGVKFVGIDRDEERVKDALARGYTAFVGDSTKDETLQKAKVDKARGLVACLGDDSANLFVTLSARQQNPDLFIVSRANHSENVGHMQRAGADKVAMPNQIGGFHMATMLTRPGVVDYLEVISKNHSSELEVDEMVIPKHSKALGDKLGEIIKKAGGGATILAVNTAEGKSIVSPEANALVNAGDKLIVMGKRTELDALSKHI